MPVSLDVLGRLARGLVHETKNSLNVVVLHLQAMSDKVERTLPSERAQDLGRHLHALGDQAQRIDRLVTRFGALVAQSHREDGPCDLSALVADAVALCEHEARKLRVPLESEIAPGVVAAVGHGALEAALVGLLFEAIDRAALREGRAQRAALRIELSAGGTLSLEGFAPRTDGGWRKRFEGRAIGAKIEEGPGGRIALRFVPLAPPAAAGG